ncbi:uncharacterized protein LOC108679205 [Hyalella azteca]|uniref:Uncharacterized protein LOC108679205 n=1 Tax=Hyalella azteca TaxID=294128 RepID=A0A8B7PAV7_HYAAZ|nr:uncharacterized protein LOC108679205 [Hyalella azteca]
MAATWALLCLAAMAAPATSLGFMASFAGKALPPRYSQVNTTFATACQCRMACLVNPACAAVSTAPEIVMSNPTGMFLCTFARVNVVDAARLINATSSQAITSIKDFKCDAPFKLIFGVGCILVVEEKLDFENATENCPPGSALYTPEDDVIFHNFIEYMKLKTLGRMDFWLGFKNFGNAQNQTWAWFDGRIVSSTTGSWYWTKYEPDGTGTECARLFGNGAETGMKDNPCSSRYSSVCQMNSHP